MCNYSRLTAWTYSYKWAKENRGGRGSPAPWLFAPLFFSSRPRSVCVRDTKGFITSFILCSTWEDLSTGLNFSCSSFTAWQQPFQQNNMAQKETGHFSLYCHYAKKQEPLKCLAAQSVHKLLCLVTHTNRETPHLRFTFRSWRDSTNRECHSIVQDDWGYFGILSTHEKFPRLILENLGNLSQNYGI